MLKPLKKLPAKKKAVEHKSKHESILGKHPTEINSVASLHLQI